MIVAHVMGMPIEESVLQLAPFGAAFATVIGIAARTRLSQFRRYLRRRSGSPGRD